MKTLSLLSYYPDVEQNKKEIFVITKVLGGFFGWLVTRVPGKHTSSAH